MTKQQAQEILATYRGEIDDADPAFAEALALARRDPELGRWLADQQAFDAAVRAKLRHVPVPIGLKTRILAGPPLRPAVAWWQQPAWLAAAASVLLVFGVALWHRASQVPAEFALFRQQMVRYVSAGYDLDVHSSTIDQALAAFAAAGWPARFRVPAALRTLHVEGGRKLHWQSARVALLCLETADQHEVWLFAIPRAAFPDWPATESTIDNLATASWTDDDHCYLLVAQQALPDHP